MTSANKYKGVTYLSSDLGAWNNGGDGHTLTDMSGRIIASDVSLKYVIRQYWKEKFGEDKVFTIETLNDKLLPRDLKQRYEDLFEKIDTKNKELVLNNLTSCIDNRIFGFLFPVSGINMNLNGVAQFGFGVNINPYAEELILEISSAFANNSEDAEGNKEEKGRTTRGEKIVTEKALYRYSFTFNPIKLREYEKFGVKPIGEEDFNNFKDGVLYGVNNYNSATKASCKTVLSVFAKTDDFNVDFDDFLLMEDEKLIINKDMENYKDRIEKLDIYCSNNMLDLVKNSFLSDWNNVEIFNL